jgi:hypothetical protein
MEKTGAGWLVRGLDEYKGVWSCGTFNNGNYNKQPLTGELILEDFGFKKARVVINLNEVYFSSAAVGAKGYVLMGDANSPHYDRLLVTYDMVVAIAVMEIPWIGVVKLYATGTNVDKIPSNSLPMLIVTLVIIIAMMVAVGLLYDRYQNRRKG